MTINYYNAGWVSIVLAIISWISGLSFGDNIYNFYTTIFIIVSVIFWTTSDIKKTLDYIEIQNIKIERKLRSKK